MVPVFNMYMCTCHVNCSSNNTLTGHRGLGPSVRARTRAGGRQVLRHLQHRPWNPRLPWMVPSGATHTALTAMQDVHGLVRVYVVCSVLCTCAGWNGRTA